MDPDIGAVSVAICGSGYAEQGIPAECRGEEGEAEDDRSEAGAREVMVGHCARA